MQKITINLVILILFLSTAAYSEEIWANSLSPSSIQNAVNSASPGDIIVLPAGTYNNFNTQINIPNGISIRGQGKNVTILNSSGTNRIFSWNSSGVSSSYQVEISGFKLRGRGAGTSNSGYGIRITRLVDFSIHDIEFRDFCGTGITITEGRGVIYNCDFFDIYPADLSMMGYGISVHGDDIWDNPKPPLGTQNVIFVEDCSFSNCKHGVDSNEDGRYVVRYNNFYHPHRNRGMIVVHGKQPQHNASGNTWEIYENTLYGDSIRTDDWGITVRGGSGVIWNNTFYDLEDTGSHKAIGFSIDEHGNYPSDYPDPFQVINSYIWGNIHYVNSIPVSVRVTNFASDWIQNGRDFFMFQKSDYIPYPYPHPLRSSGTVSASISASPTSGIAPLMVDFAGSATRGTPPYQFNWNFGDGGTSNLQNPSHTYSSAGDYPVILTVTDSNNGQGSSFMTIYASNDHEVTTPNKPTGLGSGAVNNSYSFSTSGASCSQGHNIEYRFSWGGNQFSDWSSSTTSSHTWTEPGTYWVMVRARCINDTSIRSDWSIGLVITISEPASHSVTTPNTPTGPSSGAVNNSYSFFTGGASCSHGHNIEYRFSWGGNQFSDWSSSATSYHNWTEPGTYWVMVRARCAIDNSIRSNWSAGMIIQINANASAYRLTIASQTISAIQDEGGTTKPITGIHSFPPGSNVTITATANQDYRFSKWTGDVNGVGRYNKTTNLIMERDKSVTAKFFTKCGDVNGDLRISPKDAQDTFDIFLGRIPNPTEAQKENADVNCDGTENAPKVTPTDAQAIFQKYLGISELPGDCSCKSRANNTAVSSIVQMAQKPTHFLRIEDIEVSPEQQTLVPIIIENPIDLMSFGFELVFPPEILKFEGIAQTELTKDFIQIDGQELSQGLLRVGGYSTNPIHISPDSIFIALIFKVKNTAFKNNILFIKNTYDDLLNVQTKPGRINIHNPKVSGKEISPKIKAIQKKK